MSSDREVRGPLTPLLGPDASVADPAVLVTWHEAISSALGVEVPHDLFALWLYPAEGGVVLLGPEALAEDQLAVPLPAPHVRQDQLFALEERIRQAGYASALCLPIPFGGSDVGLMLFAALQPAVYGARQAIVLQDVARRLGPTMARVSRRWSGLDDVEPTGEHRALEAVVEALGPALTESKTPRDFAQALFAVLRRAIPHDRAELLVGGGAGAGDQWYRVGEHGGGPLWSDPALVVMREDVDVAALFGDESMLVVADTRRDPRWAGWPDGTRALRSAVGARLVQSERTVGYLVLGSAGAGLYGAPDAALLARVAALVAARVENFQLSAQMQLLRTHLGTLRNVPAHLARLAETLAVTPDPREALRRCVTEAMAALPFDRLRFAVRLADAAREPARGPARERLVLLDPADPRPLAELPADELGGTALEQVAHGGLPNALLARDPESELVVPLRVHGETIGALSLAATGGTPYTRADLALAQQLADAVAPHVALLRVAAQAGAPGAPGAAASARPAAAPVTLVPPAVSAWLTRRR
ncbi:MAG TPA: GAF domain-containing protein [Gemmatimonadales bacterium]|nr:GAF domain-containing protein [Gemmatimonadales bacterium]